MLGFCLSIVRKRRRISKGKSGQVRYLPEWREACRLVGELIEFGCLETVAPVALELRQQIWNVLSLLLNNPCPTTKEERPFRDDDYEGATPAWATVRGMALFGVWAYSAWAMRGLGQPSSENGQQGLDLVPEAKTVLEKHMDSTYDPSLTIRAWYGQQLPSLAELDKNWVSQHFDNIFPLDEKKRALRHAAWTSYCLFCRPYLPLLPLLEREYRHGIGELEERDLSRQAFSPNVRLPEHIMQLYCWGIIRIDDSDGLLTYFFTHAPITVCPLILEDIGHQLTNQEEPLSPMLQGRLQALWDWRIQTLERAPQNEREELAAFRWWFNSLKFPYDWSLAQLERTLRLCGKMKHASSIVEHLAQLSETFPFQAVQCFALLLESTDDDWKPSTWHELVETILRNAITLGQNGAIQIVKELINRLGARGEDYTSVLMSSE